MVAKKKTTKASKKKSTSVSKKKTKKTTEKKKSIKKKSTKKKSTTSKSKKSPPTSKTQSLKVAKSVESTAQSKDREKIKPTSTKRKNYFAVDKQILLALTNAPNNSLVVDELIERFNLSRDEIDKSIKRLESKDPPKIRTNLVMYQSRWVKQITKIDDFGITVKKQNKSKKLVWETINDLPCFICPFSKKCNEGQKQYNPKKCPYLTDWLISSINNEQYLGNPFHQEYDSKKTKNEIIP
ncbi:MAG: hypothetical protein K9W44_18575 [Candidatus Lokiarchaeota archaeon]|nr:hypothetical protein [Candidatus Harpocratesius repetitus]